MSHQLAAEKILQAFFLKRQKHQRQIKISETFWMVLSGTYLVTTESPHGVKDIQFGLLTMM
jgi:hypothetical protein